MKKFFLPFMALLLTAFTFIGKRLPDRIPTWVLERQTAFVNYYDDEIFLNPATFYDEKISKICNDSFLLNPETILKAQVFALAYEQVDYGYSWSGVSVGYGMLPGGGNFWENVSPNYFIKEAKELLMKRLIRNRASQTLLYEWAKPSIMQGWESKPDTAKTLDIFAIWKTKQYLANYDLAKETKREKFEKTVGAGDYSWTLKFTSMDWKNREDSDAKLYAFWHRRIKEQNQTGTGFSLADAKYWTEIAETNMLSKANANVLKILAEWQKDWIAGKITHPKLK